LELELHGSNVIHHLMDHMWSAISRRKSFDKLGSRRTDPKDAYVYSTISDSYRWHFENDQNPNGLPIRYRELKLLTDMISGMTDRFAVEHCEKISRAVNG
jgi:dGTPase